MHILDLKASVGYGASQDNTLIFIFHISKHPENIYWSVSYSFPQLNRIDQFITNNCDYLRHSHFPSLHENELQSLIKYLIDIQRGSKLLRPTGSLQALYQRTKESEKYILIKLNRLQEIIENWFHLVLLRFHILPFKVKEELMNMFCLPYGPVNESDAVKYGLDKLLSETTLAPQRLRLAKETRPTGIHENAAYVEMVQREVELADSLPPLLRTTVTKGPRNERGKQEYTVSI